MKAVLAAVGVVALLSTGAQAQSTNQLVGRPQAVLPPADNSPTDPRSVCAFVMINNAWYTLSKLLPNYTDDYNTILAAAASPTAQLRILLDAPPNAACNGIGSDVGTIYRAFWSPMLVNP